MFIATEIMESLKFELSPLPTPGLLLALWFVMELSKVIACDASWAASREAASPFRCEEHL